VLKNKMSNIFYIAQITISSLLVVAILLQQRGTALGPIFGQGSNEFYGLRRGIEKKLYWITIILAAIFISLDLTFLVIK